MLQRLLFLFQPEDRAQRVEQELAALEAQLLGAASDYRATLLARAADLCIAAGDDERARTYFGRAIDAYLEFGYYDVAAALCQRVIELYPTVVRTRCTLAFLALGRDLPHLPFRDVLEDARREIGHYVAAAWHASLERLAAERLRLMADVTDRHDIREVIGEYLLELGDSAGADGVFGSVNAERNQVQVPATVDQRERWARALRVSIVSPVAAAAAAPEVQA
jgi:tetratricopeptide (TPR) repeat protein